MYIRGRVALLCTKDKNSSFAFVRKDDVNNIYVSEWVDNRNQALIPGQKIVAGNQAWKSGTYKIP